MEVTRICKVPGGNEFLSQGFSVTVTESDLEGIGVKEEDLLHPVRKFNWLSYVAECLLSGVVGKSRLISPETSKDWQIFAHSLNPNSEKEA